MKSKKIDAVAAVSKVNPLMTIATEIVRVTLQNIFGDSIMFTQTEVCLRPTKTSCGKYSKEVLVEAFFCCSRDEKQFGQEYRAPIPPKVIARVFFSCGTSDLVRDWQYESMSIQLENTITPDNAMRIDILSLPDIVLVESLFKKHRPRGFTIMPEAEDRFMWTINPTSGEIVNP